MIEYPKIQSVFKRDPITNQFLEGQWSTPELEYLKDLYWDATEKVDGTNIRVVWGPYANNQAGAYGYSRESDSDFAVMFFGRTKDAQMPPFLLEKLKSIFTHQLMESTFGNKPVTLYGEGYGARIQKGGGNYIPNDTGFIMFDVLIDRWWLRRDAMMDIATKLAIPVVPMVNRFTLPLAIELIKNQVCHSSLRTDGGLAEGLVLRPPVELRDRNGERIITKVKHKDFTHGKKWDKRISERG